MANPEWGGKHTCQHCGVKYYDLNRSPIVCPKCSSEFNPDALLRSRRSKPAVAEKAPLPQAVAAAPGTEEDEAEAAEDLETDDLEAVETDDEVEDLDEEDEKDKLIEDVSELGEDEDDMAEVLVEGDEPDDT